MSTISLNLQEFEKKFGSEEQCLDYIYYLRWENGFRCPRCQCDKKWNIKKYKYKCRNCKYQTTVTAGTMFHNTRVPLSYWFLAIWYFTTSEGRFTAKELEEIIGVGSSRTAQNIMRKLKNSMIRLEQKRLYEMTTQDKLQGLVEVGQEFVIIPSHGGVKIAIAVEVDKSKIGRIRMNVVRDKYSSNFNHFIEDNVDFYSMVVFYEKRTGWLKSERYYEGNQATTNYISYVRKIMPKFSRWLSMKERNILSQFPLPDILKGFCIEFNSNKYKVAKTSFYELLHSTVKPLPEQLKNERSS